MAVPSVPNESHTSGTGNTLGPSNPTGTTTDDWLLAICSCDVSTGTVSWSTTLDGVAMDAVFSSLKGGATAGTALQVFKKKFTGSGAVSATRTGGSGQHAITVLRFPAAEVDATDPVHVVQTNSFDSGDEATIPEITTTVADCRIIGVETWDESKTLNANPTGYTTIFHHDLSSHDQLVTSQAKATAGTVSAVAADLSAGTRTANCAIAIKASGSTDATAAPGAGSLTLTGQAPTLAASSTASPTTQALTLTGFAPSVAAHYTASPSTQALILTGQAPTISANAAVAPTTQALVLTGFAPDVASVYTAEPATGSLVLTGFAPSVTASSAVSPGAGSLTLTGYAPDVVAQTSAEVFPGVGVLVLTGQAPSVAVSVAATPAGGSLVIEGQAPSVSASASITPDTQALVFTGYVPALVLESFLTIPSGSLAFTGYAPRVNTGFVRQAPASPTWTAQAPESETWTRQAPGAGNWSAQSPEAETWTRQTPDAATWTPQ